MFKKMYKRYARVIIAALIILMISMLMSCLGNELQHINLYLSVLMAIYAVICFVGMYYYTEILNVLSKVTDMSKNEIFCAVVTHSITLTAGILFVLSAMVKDSLYMKGLAVLFVVLSAIIRLVCGVRNIDSQIGELCKELDLELFRYGQKEGMLDEELEEFDDTPYL